jgi:hypothetical protein
MIDKREFIVKFFLGPTYDVLHGGKFKGMNGGKAKLMVNKKWASCLGIHRVGGPF